MVTITFPNHTIELQAVTFLLGKYPSKAIRKGVHELSEEAVEALRKQSIPFEIKVPSTKVRPGESRDDEIAAPTQRRRKHRAQAARKPRT